MKKIILGLLLVALSAFAGKNIEVYCETFTFFSNG